MLIKTYNSSKQYKPNKIRKIYPYTKRIDKILYKL